MAKIKDLSEVICSPELGSPQEEKDKFCEILDKRIEDMDREIKLQEKNG